MSRIVIVIRYFIRCDKTGLPLILSLGNRKKSGRVRWIRGLWKGRDWMSCQELINWQLCKQAHYLMEESRAEVTFVTLRPCRSLRSSRQKTLTDCRKFGMHKLHWFHSRAYQWCFHGDRWSHKLDATCCDVVKPFYPAFKRNVSQILFTFTNSILNATRQQDTGSQKRL
jgi:hypothetical protein